MRILKRKRRKEGKVEKKKRHLSYVGISSGESYVRSRLNVTS